MQEDDLYQGSAAQFAWQVALAKCQRSSHFASRPGDIPRPGHIKDSTGSLFRADRRVDPAARRWKAVDARSLPGWTHGTLQLLEACESLGAERVATSTIQEKTKVGEYLVADSIEAVVALAQMGIVEIHTWNSTAEEVERPNRIVWDLDPGPHVTWKQVVTAAKLVRACSYAWADVVGEDHRRPWVACSRADHTASNRRGMFGLLTMVAEAIERTNERCTPRSLPRPGESARF